jgi:hypothetical protein
MGPREGLHMGSNELPWANSSGLAGGSAYTLWTHAIIVQCSHSASCKLCGPTRHSCREALRVVDGPTQDLMSCRGPTQVNRQVAVDIHCGPTRWHAHGISGFAVGQLEQIGR